MSNINRQLIRHVRVHIRHKPIIICLSLTVPYTCVWLCRGLEFGVYMFFFTLQPFYNSLFRLSLRYKADRSYIHRYLRTVQY
jgi:hypothetical protein